MKIATAQRLLTRCVAVAALCLAIQACKEDLYTNLEEREANAMVAVLLQKGIPASRVIQKNGKLSVTVEESQFAQAVTALNEAGLPKNAVCNNGQRVQTGGPGRLACARACADDLCTQRRAVADRVGD